MKDYNKVGFESAFKKAVPNFNELIAHFEHKSKSYKPSKLVFVWKNQLWKFEMYLMHELEKKFGGDNLKLVLFSDGSGELLNSYNTEMFTFNNIEELGVFLKMEIEKY